MYFHVVVFSAIALSLLLNETALEDSGLLPRPPTAPIQLLAIANSNAINSNSMNYQPNHLISYSVLKQQSIDHLI